MKLFKLSALSVSLLALATLSSSAFAQTVISDSFDASSGPANNSINGIAPTGANLPGGNWSVGGDTNFYAFQNLSGGYTPYGPNTSLWLYASNGGGAWWRSHRAY